MCGLGCKKYVEANISHKSRTAVKYTMKTLASCAETVIFMLLGISAVDSSKWAWDSGLVLGTLFFILFFRALGIAGALCSPDPFLSPPLIPSVQVRIRVTSHASPCHFPRLLAALTCPDPCQTLAQMLGAGLSVSSAPNPLLPLAPPSCCRRGLADLGAESVPAGPSGQD